ncbi:MAG: exodeoxyribonuclease V subunit alpha [Buchnera aphidicola (Nurudea yanoniella)]
MKIISFLTKCIEKKIINQSDLYFSLSIAGHQSSQTILLITYISCFIRMGHTCLPISVLKNPEKLYEIKNTKLIKEISKMTKILKNLLLQMSKNKISSNGSHLTPLVIIDQKIYFLKMWIAEKKIFNFISTPQNFEFKKLVEIKKKITPLLSSNTENSQKIAIIFSIINKITFIIGDPGTGKTTIVSKILTAIKIASFPKKLKIQLAATTGKAAYALTKSIQKSILKLTQFYKNNEILIKPAITLHRLLGNNLENHKNFNNFLDIDILVIDESSMIDIFIMEKIIDNIPKKTKIIFLGDHNQLPSINCGNILQDIYSYYCKGYGEKTIKKINFFKIYNINIGKSINDKFSNINEKICVLKKNYRFNISSNIYKISQKIKEDKFNNFKKLFSNAYKDINFFPLSTNKNYEKMIKNLTKSYTNYWNILKKEKPLDTILEFNNHRLICILKNGPFGIKGLNLALEYEMKHQKFIKNTVLLEDKKKIYFGQPILILKNNYTLKLYNGDIGIIMYGKNKKLQAFFLNEEKKTRSIPINLLPKFQTSWAMSAHKSQGSEFVNLTLILPNTQIKILNKNIIYTAITRAKKKLTIYSDKKILKKSIRKKIIRHSGLCKKECIH